MPTKTFDYRTSLYGVVWNILMDSAELMTYFTSGGQKIDLTVDGSLRRRIARGLGDFQQIMLEIGIFTSSVFDNKSAVFASEDPAALLNNADLTYPLLRSISLTLTVTNDSVKIGEADQIEESAQRALIESGPKLGQYWIQNWGPMTAVQVEAKSSKTANARRLTTTIQIPTTVIYNTNQQVTEV